jgi:hypothetical protein
MAFDAHADVAFQKRKGNAIGLALLAKRGRDADADSSPHGKASIMVAHAIEPVAHPPHARNCAQAGRIPCKDDSSAEMMAPPRWLRRNSTGGEVPDLGARHPEEVRT